MGTHAVITGIPREIRERKPTELALFKSVSATSVTIKSHCEAQSKSETTTSKHVYKEENY